jgi:amino acid permease
MVVMSTTVVSPCLPLGFLLGFAPLVGMSSFLALVTRHLAPAFSLDLGYLAVSEEIVACELVLQYYEVPIFSKVLFCKFIFVFMKRCNAEKIRFSE